MLIELSAGKLRLHTGISGYDPSRPLGAPHSILKYRLSIHTYNVFS